MYFSSAEPLIGDTLHIELEFENIGFVRGKTICHLPFTWRKASWSKDKNQKQTDAESGD